MADAEWIGQRRCRIFIDAGQADEAGLKTEVDDARRRGIKVVSLHASKFGRPLYERNGFDPTNEMILRFTE